MRRFYVAYEIPNSSGVIGQGDGEGRIPDGGKLTFGQIQEWKKALSDGAGGRTIKITVIQELDA
jgi:hypothetical protein